MAPHPAGRCFALYLRVGHQNNLLSPLLVRLYARLQDVPGGAVIAVTRNLAHEVSAVHTLVRLPGYTRAQARNFLIAWAETAIDALHHAHPYHAPRLLEGEPVRDGDPNRPLVRCEQADAALWLRANADADTAAALMAMSEHLCRLLKSDAALLKTALPAALSAVLEVQDPGSAEALSGLVFVHTPSAREIARLLRKRQALERDGQLIRYAGLPSDALAAFAHLVSAVQHGRAVSDARVTGFSVVRILLNQLGFEGTEADYLILLSLPPKAWRTLHPPRRGLHAI